MFQKCILENTETALFLEDDVVLLDGWQDKIKQEWNFDKKKDDKKDKEEDKEDNENSIEKKDDKKEIDEVKSKIPVVAIPKVGK